LVNNNDQIQGGLHPVWANSGIVFLNLIKAFSKASGLYDNLRHTTTLEGRGEKMKRAEQCSKSIILEKLVVAGVLAVVLTVLLLALPAWAWTPSWSWVNPLPQGNSFFSVASNGRILVAVGDLGTIMTSPDGVNWTRRTSGISEQLNKVAYGNNIFVAVGNNNVICTSPDGITWTRRTAAVINLNMNDVTYGNNTFVAVGTRGTVMTSPDGISWVKRYVGYTNELLCVAYGNNTFVIADDIFNVLTSPDGVNWARTRGSYEAVWLKRMAFGHIVYTQNPTHRPKFVVVGKEGKIFSSPDGMTWTRGYSGTAQNLYSVAYQSYPAQFHAVGEYGTIISSSDGNNFIGSPVDVVTHLTGITGERGPLVAVGRGGAIMTCNGLCFNLSAWAKRFSTVVSNDLLGATYGGNGFGFVAVGAFGTIMTSIDGNYWVRRGASGTMMSLRGVAHTGNSYIATGGDTRNNYVAVGDSGTIFTSIYGVWWDKRSSGTSAGLMGVTYGNNTYVTVGAAGTILTSPNAVMWTRRNSPVSTGLNAVTYSANKFVAVGENGQILTSNDGIIWTQRASGTNNSLSAIAFGRNQFVVIGKGGTILTSPDGITWIKRYAPTSEWLAGITYGNLTFVAVGYDGNTLTSSDGVTWTPGSNVTARHLGVTFGNGTFISVGISGAILKAVAPQLPRMTVPLR
jgi:photosystem II stability/assembly factor-like uncharacterized protein